MGTASKPSTVFDGGARSKLRGGMDVSFHGLEEWILNSNSGRVFERRVIGHLMFPYLSGHQGTLGTLEREAPPYPLCQLRAREIGGCFPPYSVARGSGHARVT